MSDPFAVLYIKAESEVKWQSLGKTEVVYNNLNPVFMKPFIVNYLFEKNQTIKCEIYDFDEEESELIGSYSVMMNKLITSPTQSVKGDLQVNEKKGSNRGKVIVSASSVENSNNQVKMSVKCSLIPKKSEKKSFFSCCRKFEEDNPYLIVEREALASDEIDDAWIPVYKSDVKYGETEVSFPKLQINLNFLT